MSTQAERVKTHWANNQDTSEKALHIFAEKFRLKFATVVSDSQPEANGHKAALEKDGLVGLTADQGKGLGWATFYFHV